MTRSKVTPLALATALAVAPAFAQPAPGNPMPGPGSTGAGTAQTGAAGNNGATVGRATPDTTAPALAPGNPAGVGPATATRQNSNAPSDKNPVFADNGDVRASKLIGSSVYNDKDEKIGSVDDILLGQNNQPTQAVLSIGGFLGMGSKLVTVPYDQLKFGNTNANSDQRVMLPGATRDALNKMESFHYSTRSG